MYDQLTARVSSMVLTVLTRQDEFLAKQARLTYLAAATSVPVEPFVRYNNEPVYESMSVDKSTLDSLAPEAAIDVERATTKIIAHIAKKVFLSAEVVKISLDLISRGNSVRFTDLDMAEEMLTLRESLDLSDSLHRSLSERRNWRNAGHSITRT